MARPPSTSQPDAAAGWAALFAWPDWVNRTTIFGAYGNPYLNLPGTSGLAVLATIAVGGGILAAAVAHRTPKVAT